MSRGVVCVAVMSLLGLTLLTGCETGPAVTTSPAPPSATPLTAEALAEQPLLDTTWTGVDSVGDVTGFTLSSDRTVVVEYNGRQWHEASDTWSLADGVLTIRVHVDATHGELVYAAPYTEGATMLEATATATISGHMLTVTLDRS